MLQCFQSINDPGELPEQLALASYIVWVLVGYFVGSIPVAWLATKLVTGNDLRQLGSGNVGVMNTALSAARWAGLLVLLAEIMKGALAVLIPRALGADEITVCLTVLAVVAGTRWSIWLHFAGGRGNTAGVAALVLISWQAAAVVFAIWILVFLMNHNSFTTTRTTLLLLPVIIAVVTHSVLYVLTGMVLSILYLITQRKETDDHLILKQNWPSLLAFITSPPRKRNIEGIVENNTKVNH